MKTKIIYISGNETFEMIQIRAAFEEVRATLGLDKDTVLFGVPVDCDSALSDACVVEDTVITENSEIIPTTQIIPDITTAAENNTVVEEPVVTPVAEIIPEPVTEIIAESAESEEDVATVVPILSVLGGGESESVEQDVLEHEIASDEITEVQEDIEPVTDVESIIEEVSIADTNIITDEIVDAEPVVITDTSVEVEDIVDDSTPETPMEKTLEQLLESMTPLREDVMVHDEPVIETADDSADVFSADDTDATLAQLASEFVQNEDKIPTTPKTETSGKIGKLKNILPFKKAKREDSGLMGDLFGWAGIAANDEDFAIPGFFTQTASKK